MKSAPWVSEPCLLSGGNALLLPLLTAAMLTPQLTAHKPVRLAAAGAQLDYDVTLCTNYASKHCYSAQNSIC